MNTTATGKNASAEIADDYDNRLRKMFHILADSSRYHVFKLLLQDENFCVGELAQNIGISMPAVSQHLRIFELSGLVIKNRQGLRVCYKLNTQDPLVDLMSRVVQAKEEDYAKNNNI
jgi:DNA-binding transcriptional ArsR family regulator